MPGITTRVLDGFDDPTFGPAAWDELLLRGNRPAVFLTWHFQRAWWESHDVGELLIIVAEREGNVIALAPFYTKSRMIFFLGTSGSDYLDFIGDISDCEVLDALLRAAWECVPEFCGFALYSVPDYSRTGEMLKDAALRLGLDCFSEEDMPAPALDLAGQPELALAATSKKSLLQSESYFRRKGSLQVHHFHNGNDILPHLDEFFEQHRSRRAITGQPSGFEEEGARAGINRLIRYASNTGWLRFTRIDWNGRAIAFHFGFSYQGRYVYYLPTFAIDLARWSPGQLLLRQVLLSAMSEGASVFDFGTGDEPYKSRFATDVHWVRMWGLYPRRSPAKGAVNGSSAR
jgi:CelD/BcsL family acetyltransferase involved in cellulose biosynthesis